MQDFPGMDYTQSFSSLFLRLVDIVDAVYPEGVLRLDYHVPIPELAGHKFATALWGRVIFRQCNHLFGIAAPDTSEIVYRHVLLLTGVERYAEGIISLDDTPKSLVLVPDLV